LDATRWRRASKRRVEPAMAALRDSTAQGMRIRWSARARASEERPAPSLPMRIAVREAKVVCRRLTELLGWASAA